MECIILAGGLGTRLKHLIPNKPKCLAPVGDKTFLDYLMGFLISQKIQHFVFSVGHMADQIKDHISENYDFLKVDYAEEKTPLGTGGGIAFALKQCQSENVFIVNADTLSLVDFDEMLNKHTEGRSECTIAVKKMYRFERYGTLYFDGEYWITNFIEKQKQEEGYINTGVYLVNRKAFQERIFSDVFSFETDYLESLVSEKIFLAFPNKGFFIDIGVPEDFIAAQKSVIHAIT